ncbi:DnaJ C-terminal domain-containing protein [Marinobacterium aestuariivivens]|uniref:DnaJ C-terminal domain-containing protein n=1 Tax=Marinobacterium aestuariivivens TaxID=1698799 RepID=A0ABW1ZVW3_9GAMM
MEFKDYYRILGVDPEADKTAIKAAYRKLARRYHPDVSSEEDAEAHFKEVSEAYEVLKDAQKRAEYDELRRYGRHGKPFEPPPGWQSSAEFRADTDPFGGFSDFFESIFGGARQQHRPRGEARGFASRGRDIELDLPIFLEDTLSEESKPISFEVPQVDASGHLVQKRRRLNVRIPAGVVDGERIRLKGQGAPGLQGGTPGDLYLRIRLVPHPLFDVEGHNLIITVPLTPWEAALGARIQVPTLNGRIQLKIPPSSQTGQRLRIRGKGLPGRGGARGDLYAVLKVVMPPAGDTQAEKLWQQLADAVPFDPRADWSKS